jgi:dTDP-4-amino-4,6-dideoxygalactose transaminase
MSDLIPFNRPYLTGKESKYIRQAVASGKISGNGMFTKKCHQFLEQRYGFKKCLLTTSCTDALEMAALLLDIRPGDEVIMPSFTFVSTANAFVLRGATIIFCDSRKDHPCIDEDLIEPLITERTKVIVPVHYAGMSCDMDKIMALADKYGLYVVEDAAQAIDSYYTGKDGKRRTLGSIGHMAAFSFHETKNIMSGEGGMIVINDDRFMARAEIVWEKGTNRNKFFRGEVDKYEWVDIGSSFQPSDIIAAFLYAQLEQLDRIQKKREQIWDTYYSAISLFAEKRSFSLPVIAQYAINNSHMFYLVFNDLEKRTDAIKWLNTNNIQPVFHYISLHRSPYYAAMKDKRELPNADRYTDGLLRLPMYFKLNPRPVIEALRKWK